MQANWKLENMKLLKKWKEWGNHTKTNKTRRKTDQKEKDGTPYHRRRKNANESFPRGSRPKF